MPAPKTSEDEIGAMLRRMNLFEYKLADIPIPKWTGNKYEGFAHLKQKPFDIFVVGPGGGGAVEVKSGQTSFSFMTLKGWVPQHLSFHCGFGATIEDNWPDALEKLSHGIKPHQRRGLSRMYLRGGHSFLALMLGTGQVNSPELPRKMWLVPWMWWCANVETPLLAHGQSSLSYDHSTTHKLSLRNAGLYATNLLRDYELEWNPALKEKSKWQIPNGSVLQKRFTSISGVEGMTARSPRRASLIQHLSEHKAVTVWPPGFAASSPATPP